MAGTHLQGENKQHKKIITGKRSKPDIIVVRCKCMAEYRNVSDRYYNYDSLGETTSLREAHQIYDRHLEESP